MELRINRLDETTHRAAKMLAAHKGVSLNKFVLDAIHHECIRIAHKEGLAEAVLQEIERKDDQPEVVEVKGSRSRRKK